MAKTDHVAGLLDALRELARHAEGASRDLAASAHLLAAAIVRAEDHWSKNASDDSDGDPPERTRAHRTAVRQPMVPHMGSNADSSALLSRRQLARRWSVSIETIKRRERSAVLIPLRLSRRMIRYRLSDVEMVESQAGGTTK